MHVAITGANRGIGLALARIYSRGGHQVVALCRHESDELKKLENVSVLEGVDARNPKQEELLQKQLEKKSIGIFIHNAGIARSDTLENLNMDDIREQFEVNSLGPLNTVIHMLPYLKPNAKIGIVSSRMGSIGDNDSGGYYGYRMSKAAANAAGRSLAIDLKERGNPVALLHPGYVQTDMTSQRGDIKPDEAAQGIYEVMEKLSLETTGQFWHQKGTKLPW